MAYVVIALIVLLCAGGASFVLWRSQARPRTAPKQVPQKRGPQPIGDAEPADAPVEHIAIVQLTDGSYTIAGDRRLLDTIGTTIDELPAPMMTAIAATSTAFQGIEIAGEITTRTLALTKESVAMFEKCGALKDAAGGTLVVTRDAAGKINHVARVAEIGGSAATAIASAGTAIALLAIQMQLQQISKQLGQIDSNVTKVARHQESELLAQIHQRHLALVEVAKTVELTGILDETTWSQIAHLGDAIRVTSHQVEKRVREVTSPVRAVGGKNGRKNPTERLAELRRIERDDKPILWAHALFQSKHSEILMYQLEIFRRMTVNDPNLEVHRQELGRRAGESVTAMADALAGLQEALTEAGNKLPGYEWYDIHNFKSFDETEPFKKMLGDLKEASAEVSGPAKKAVEIINDSAPLRLEAVREPRPIIGAPIVAVDPPTAPIGEVVIPDEF